MVLLQKINPVVRAVLVIATVAALVTSVTFALQNQATLTNNTISSVTAALQVDNTDNGAGFGASDTGYAFDDVVPGADFGTGSNFQLKNNGSAELKVKVHTTVGAPTGTVDKSKVHVKFENVTSGGDATYTLAELESAARDVPGVSGAGSLDPTEVNDFTVKVKMDADAVSGSSGAVGHFSMVFTGAL